MHQQPPHRHLVEGQRPGLVGRDVGGASERFDGRELFDDRAARREPGRAHRQGECDDRGESLGDGGDRERHSGDEEFGPRLPAQQTEDEH